MTAQKLSFSLVGPGRLGMNLAHELINNGFIARTIISKTDKSIRKAKSILSAEQFSTGIEDLTDPGDILFISVPDDSIKDVVKEIFLKVPNLSRTACLHFSGVNSSRLLRSLEEKGAFIGSLHPLYSFPGEIEPIPPGILFTYEGGEAAGTIAEKVVSTLNGRILNIDSGQKPLYHLAAVLSGNMGLTLSSIAAGIINEVLGPDPQEYRKEISIYLQSVLKNIRENSWADALTGPVKRGDQKTLDKHMDALEKAGRTDIKDLYEKLIELTKNMLDQK